jgi:hypothetical protein
MDLWPELPVTGVPDEREMGFLRSSLGFARDFACGLPPQRTKRAPETPKLPLRSCPHSGSNCQTLKIESRQMSATCNQRVQLDASRPGLPQKDAGRGAGKRELCRAFTTPSARNVRWGTRYGAPEFPLPYPPLPRWARLWRPLRGLVCKKLPETATRRIARIAEKKILRPCVLGIWPAGSHPSARSARRRPRSSRFAHARTAAQIAKH